MKILADINEATRTKTKTKTADTVGMNAFQSDMDNMGQTQNVPQQRQSINTPELRRANAAVTRQKASQVDMPPEAAQKLSFLDRLGLEDEISDEEAAARSDVTQGAEPRPQEPTTMPARISQEIAAKGSVEPEWHAVRNLPGYMKSAIRAMGRQVFSTFTSTPIEDIEVIANLNGSGPNEDREINAVAGWLKQNAERHTDGEMKFQRAIPDYDANFAMYKSDGQTFLLVKDFAGKYIYSWSSADEHGTERGNLGLRNEVQRRLR